MPVELIRSTNYDGPFAKGIVAAPVIAEVKSCWTVEHRAPQRSVRSGTYLVYRLLTQTTIHLLKHEPSTDRISRWRI